LILSGHALEHRQAATALGAVAVFEKPYDPVKLLAAIETAVADRPK